ncbi:MAG: hypothetical protein II261_09280, partial [Bacteroidaceae bacterium]|nr:hypothetical protein [Bacteroidaceae bacterium]
SRRLTAKGQSKKYVLLFFCRNQKLKASNEKRSEIIRETLSLKLQGCWGEAKTFPVQKQNAFFDLLIQK